MSLITCKECNVKISSKADKCPHCGAPVKKKTSLWVWLIGAIVLITVFGGKSPTKPTAAPAPAPVAAAEPVSAVVTPPIVEKTVVNPDGERAIKTDGFIGCVSEATFKSISAMRNQGDNVATASRLMPELAAGRCVMFKQGDVVFLSDTKIFSGMIKVRPVGVTLEYWTNIEAL